MVSSRLTSHVSDCFVRGPHPLNLSDHFSVHAMVDLGSIPLRASQGPKQGRILWNRMSAMDCKHKYADVLQPTLSAIADRFIGGTVSAIVIDTAFADIELAVHEVSAGLPRAKFRKHHKPYWCDELSGLKQIKVAAYKDWVAGGRPWDHLDALFLRYKQTKKSFAKRLRSLSIAYENEEITRAIRLAEVDRNSFWRLVKKARGSQGMDSISIRNKSGKVVYEVEDVLHVWKDHFEKLGTPKAEPHYDAAHYDMVSRQVQLYNCGGERSVYNGGD